MKKLKILMVAGLFILAVTSCEKEEIIPVDGFENHNDNLKKGSPKTPIINVTDPDEDEDFDSPNKTNP